VGRHAILEELAAYRPPQRWFHAGVNEIADFTTTTAPAMRRSVGRLLDDGDLRTLEQTITAKKSVFNGLDARSPAGKTIGVVRCTLCRLPVVLPHGPVMTMLFPHGDPVRLLLGGGLDSKAAIATSSRLSCLQSFFH
jgi:hypothetical protein